MIYTARYLLFELIWALPVLALQWALGWRYLLRTWRLWVPALLALTIYFSLADAVAIQQGIWRFDETALVGLSVGNVPVEEVLFYFVTSAMILQGMVLGWFFLTERQAFTRALMPWRARRQQASLSAEEPQHQQSEGGSRCGGEDEILV
jgi:lycopene cyclase domain-containing protein